MPSIKLPGDIVIAEINNLAASLFAMHGQTVSDGFKFYAATCELGQRCWSAAVITYFNAVVRDSGVPIQGFMLPNLNDNSSQLSTTVGCLLKQ